MKKQLFSLLKALVCVSVMLLTGVSCEKMNVGETVEGSQANVVLRIGSIEQISRWMHIKERRLRKTRDYVENKGSWIAAFSFLPIFGTAISISLGILRANVWGVVLWSTIGKLLRYIIFMLPIITWR